MVGTDGQQFRAGERSTLRKQRTFPGAYNSRESLAAYQRAVEHWSEHGTVPPPEQETSWSEYLEQHARRLVGLSPRRADAVFRRAKSGAKRPPSKAAQPWERRSFGALIRRVCERNGIPRWTPHQLRHSCATEIYNSGRPIAAAMLQLGHRSHTTTERYILPDNNLAKELAREIC